MFFTEIGAAGGGRGRYLKFLGEFIIWCLGIPGIFSHENGILWGGVGGGESSLEKDLKEEDEFEEREGDEERECVLLEDGNLDVVIMVFFVGIPLMGVLGSSNEVIF